MSCQYVKPLPFSTSAFRWSYPFSENKNQRLWVWWWKTQNYEYTLLFQSQIFFFRQACLKGFVPWSIYVYGSNYELWPGRRPGINIEYGTIYQFVPGRRPGQNIKFWGSVRYSGFRWISYYYRVITNFRQGLFKPNTLLVFT